MAEEKNSTWINVGDWQIKGKDNIPLSKESCQPFVNSKTGKEFYRVDLGENTVLRNETEECDVSGHSFSIPAKSVRNAKYGGKGIWMPEGWTLVLTKNEKQADDTYQEVSRVTIGGPEDKFALTALKDALIDSRKIWRENHPKDQAQTKEQANPKQDIAQGKAIAGQAQTQPKQHEQTLAR